MGCLGVLGCAGGLSGSGWLGVPAVLVGRLSSVEPKTGGCLAGLTGRDCLLAREAFAPCGAP